MTDFLLKMIAKAHADDDTCVCLIPKGIETTNEVIEYLTIGLRFPDYYGRNWNALDDSLDDLPWLHEKNILIIHEEFPKIPEKQLNYYIDTLKTASDFWKQDGRKTFTVLFL